MKPAIVQSPAPYVSTRRGLSRRHFLRGAGIALTLPLLDSMHSVFAGPTAAEVTRAPDAIPRRVFAICNNLGLVPDHFFPTATGRDYPLSPYLETLREHRDQFTVFSGVSHPDVDGGHPADNCFLTAAPHPGRGGFRNTISLDQFIAERIGHLTRYPSINLGVNVEQGSRSLAWTSSGVLIPCEEKVGSHDRARLDQYFTSVRELEHRMRMSQEWENKPKPKVKAPVPLDPASPKEYMEKVRLMYDMARLAFETDSTRSIALLLDSVNSPVIDVEGAHITDGYHNLSHHGKTTEKLQQLHAIDQWHMRLLGNLFGELAAVREDGQTLLDRTMILYGSNLGNANTHVTTNLPTILAGGGFRHGQHLGFNTERNYPLPNLFVSMLQRMGLEVDKFATSTGTMRGLELV